MVKKIFSTLLIIIGIVIGAIAVCIGVMICFPQISLFGFHYVKDNVVDDISILQINGEDVKISNLDGIEVDLDKYELKISRNENKTDGSIVIEKNSSFVGLLRKNSDNVLVKSLQLKPEIIQNEKGENILKIQSNEPTGIIIPSKLSINIKLSVNNNTTISNLKNISLNVKNANTNVVGNGINFATNTLSLFKESTTKSIEIQNVTVEKELQVNVPSGKVDFSKLTTDTTNVNISTRSGSFEFANVNNLKVNSETNPYIKITNNVAGELEYYAKSGSLYAKNVDKNIAIRTDSAAIEFDTIKGSINTASYSNEGKDDCDSNIKINIIEPITGLNEDNEDNIAVIRTVNGNITINKTNRNTELVTQKGTINIGKNGYPGVYCNKLNIQTRRGQVNVYFDKDKQVETNILSTQSGRVNLIDINPGNGSVIESRENTEINVGLSTLTVDDFTIKACGKPVSVEIPVNANINLNVEGKTIYISMVSISESVIKQENNYVYNAEGASGTLIVKNDRKNSEICIYDKI